MIQQSQRNEVLIENGSPKRVSVPVKVKADYPCTICDVSFKTEKSLQNHNGRETHKKKVGAADRKRKATEFSTKTDIPLKKRKSDLTSSENSKTINNLVAAEKKKLDDEFLARRVEFFDQQIQSMEQSLECPVCMETCLAPIFQCEESHLICDRCRDRVTICPVCRVKYGGKKIRARYAERDAEKIEEFRREKGQLMST